MASRYWIKLYHELLDDVKVATLRDRLYRRFIECLLLAGDNDTPDGELPPVKQIAFRLHADREQLETELWELSEEGLLVFEDGTWRVRQWAKRQGPASSAARMRRHRDRMQREQFASRDDAVTEPLRRGDDDVTNRHVDEPSPHDVVPPGYEHAQEYITAIAKVVKETYAPGINESKFRDAAYAMIDASYTVDDVASFATWWKSKGHYAGKPAIKSLVQEMSNAVTRTNATVHDFWTPMEDE